MPSVGPATPRGGGGRLAPRRNRRAALGIGAAAAVLLVALVAALGLAGAGSRAPAPAPTPAAPTGAARLAAEGPAPAFTARLLGGGSFALSQQQGKPVMVLFTASWCLSCIPEVDKMARLQDEYGPKGLQQLVLSVEADDSEADFADLRRRTKGTNLFWGLDPGQKATLAYEVRATDTKVLVDRRGQIVFRGVGPTPFETMRQQVAAVVG
jgi:peroxiredoxin